MSIYFYYNRYISFGCSNKLKLAGYNYSQLFRLHKQQCSFIGNELWASKNLWATIYSGFKNFIYDLLIVEIWSSINVSISNKGNLILRKSLVHFLSSLYFTILFLPSQTVIILNFFTSIQLILMPFSSSASLSILNSIPLPLVESCVQLPD